MEFNFQNYFKCFRCERGATMNNRSQLWEVGKHELGMHEMVNDDGEVEIQL